MALDIAYYSEIKKYVQNVIVTPVILQNMFIKLLKVLKFWFSIISGLDVLKRQVPK